MAGPPLKEKEPPRWAFWRFGYLAYRMIRDHQKYCIETGEATKQELSGIRVQVHTVGSKVDEVLSTVRQFVEMQPELKTTVTQARDKKAVGEFFMYWGKVSGGILAAIVGILTIGIWLAPHVKIWPS